MPSAAEPWSGSGNTSHDLHGRAVVRRDAVHRGHPAFGRECSWTTRGAGDRSDSVRLAGFPGAPRRSAEGHLARFTGGPSRTKEGRLHCFSSGPRCTEKGRLAAAYSSLVVLAHGCVTAGKSVPASAFSSFSADRGEEDPPHLTSTSAPSRRGQSDREWSGRHHHARSVGHPAARRSGFSGVRPTGYPSAGRASA